MTKRATLTDVATGYNSAVTLNENFQSLNERFDNTLSLDGSTPNALKADLDLNYNDLLNVNLFDTKELRINGEKVTSVTTVPYWAGPWGPQRTYAKNVLVRESGNSYISLEEHISSLSFSNDLASQKWELFASRGSAGAGTGDMLASANLSDLDDVAVARNNLGLGSISLRNEEDFVEGTTLGELATGTKEDHRVDNPFNTNDNPWLWSGSDIQSAISSKALGENQTWADVTNNRSANTSFRNTTGRPIMVSIYTGRGTDMYIQVSSDETNWVNVGRTVDTGRQAQTFVVPAGNYYRINGPKSITFWSELR